MSEPRRQPDPGSVVPNRLREFRRVHRLPGIRTIAHATGIHKSQLSRAETGERNLSDVDKVALLAYFSERLGRTVDVSEVFYQGTSAPAPVGVG